MDPGFYTIDTDTTDTYFVCPPYTYSAPGSASCSPCDHQNGISSYFGSISCGKEGDVVDAFAVIDGSSAYNLKHLCADTAESLDKNPEGKRSRHIDSTEPNLQDAPNSSVKHVRFNTLNPTPSSRNLNTCAAVNSRDENPPRKSSKSNQIGVLEIHTSQELKSSSEICLDLEWEELRGSERGSGIDSTIVNEVVQLGSGFKLPVSDFSICGIPIGGSGSESTSRALHSRFVSTSTPISPVNAPLSNSLAAEDLDQMKTVGRKRKVNAASSGQP